MRGPRRLDNAARVARHIAHGKVQLRDGDLQSHGVPENKPAWYTVAPSQLAALTRLKSDRRAQAGDFASVGQVSQVPAGIGQALRLSAWHDFSGQGMKFFF